MITHFIWLQKFRYSLILSNQEHKIYGDPNEVYLEPSKTLTQFVKDKWNDGTLSREIGVHSYSLEKFHMVTAPLLGIKTAAVDEIRIEYEIIRASYLSKAELSKGVGLYNIAEKVFMPSSDFISFGPITLEEVLKGEKVENPEEIEGTAFVGFAYHVE